MLLRLHIFSETENLMTETTETVSEYPHMRNVRAHGRKYKSR